MYSYENTDPLLYHYYYYNYICYRTVQREHCTIIGPEYTMTRHCTIIGLVGRNQSKWRSHTVLSSLSNNINKCGGVGGRGKDIQYSRVKEGKLQERLGEGGRVTSVIYRGISY
jgi:hypothetical protein